MARMVSFFSLGLVLASTAIAGAVAPTLSSAERQSFDAFAAANKTCRSWSDGCAVCKRQGEAFACSTPGIACQPSALACQAGPSSGPR